METVPVKELVRASWPEQLPILVQANELIPEMCGLPYDYLFRDDPVAMAECTLLVWEYFGFTFLRGNLEIYNYEAESMGQNVRFYKNHIPDVDRSNFLIRDTDDYDKIRFNGLDSGRFPYFIKFCEAFEKYAQIPAQVNLCAPWSLACNIHGFENLLMDTVIAPEDVHELFNRINSDLLVPMFQALHDRLPSINIIRLADAWASLPLLSQDIIEEYVIPYYRKINEEAVKIGTNTVLAGIWGHSDIDDEEKRVALVKSLVDCCGVVVGCDPDAERLGPQWFLSLAEKMEKPLSLGVSSSFMELADMPTLVGRIKDYVLAGKSGKVPFSLTLNNIGPKTPIENIHASVQAANFYARSDTDSSSVFTYEPRESFAEFVAKKKAANTEGFTFEWQKMSSIF